MRSAHLFTSIIHLFLAFLFIVLGFFFLFVPFNVAFRDILMHFFQEESQGFVLLGAILGLFGLFLLIVFYVLNRRRSYFIKMGADPNVHIDEVVIKKYILKYWQELFPGKDLDCELSIFRGKIYLLADLPPVPYEEQKTLLEKIERDLERLFYKYLGYDQEFFLTVSFKD